MSMIAAFFATTAKAEASQTFLLDEYGADIKLAYSLRKLSSTYTGNAIRVREGLFNTETDIGFDASGNLDETALLAHCASNGTGYIVKWYDQSGNGGNIQQSTSTEQPQIVSSNTVLKSNGKPVIEGNNPSTTTHLDLIAPKSTYIPSTGQYFFFSVCNSNLKGMLYAENQPNRWQFAAQDGSTSTAIRGSQYNSLGDTYRRNGASYSPSNRNVLHDDNTSQTLITVDGHLTTTDTFRLGYSFGGWDMWDMQEFLVYEGDKSSIQSDIETAINNHYSIF